MATSVSRRGNAGTSHLPPLALHHIQLFLGSEILKAGEKCIEENTKPGSNAEPIIRNMMLKGSVLTATFHSQDEDGKIYKAWVDFSRTSPGIAAAHCPCGTATGKCKHIAAILLAYISNKQPPSPSSSTKTPSTKLDPPTPTSAQRRTPARIQATDDSTDASPAKESVVNKQVLASLGIKRWTPTMAKSPPPPPTSPSISPRTSTNTTPPTRTTPPPPLERLAAADCGLATLEREVDELKTQLMHKDAELTRQLQRNEALLDRIREQQRQIDELRAHVDALTAANKMSTPSTPLPRQATPSASPIHKPTEAPTSIDNDTKRTSTTSAEDLLRILESGDDDQCEQPCRQTDTNGLASASLTELSRKRKMEPHTAASGAVGHDDITELTAPSPPKKPRVDASPNTTTECSSERPAQLINNTNSKLETVSHAVEDNGPTLAIAIEEEEEEQCGCSHVAISTLHQSIASARAAAVAVTDDQAPTLPIKIADEDEDMDAAHAGHVALSSDTSAFRADERSQ